MSPEQKQSFYDDGFLIFRDILPTEIVRAAARQIYGDLDAVWQTSTTLAQVDGDSSNNNFASQHLEAAKASLQSRKSEAILRLIDSDNALMRSINEALGKPMRPPPSAQLATLFPHELGHRLNEAGYPVDEVPFFGWHGHLDGLWNGAAPVHQRTDRAMNNEELAAWNRDPGRNGVRRIYAHANVLNFTGLLGIPLSDQMVEGSGNLGLLRGAHHPISEFFASQRERGGPLGPDGPGWERIDRMAPNQSGLRHYPDQVKNQFKEDAAYTSNGQIWPKPTLIKVRPGDAVLTLHAVPHCATRLEGVSPRLMAYFRFVVADRPSDQVHCYPDALCDCWLEWEGMREVVNDNRLSQH